MITSAMPRRLAVAFLMRPMELLAATGAVLLVAGTTAYAAAPQAGVYAGKTGQGRACGSVGTGKTKLCRASATVNADGSVRFRWAFTIRCKHDRRVVGSWYPTFSSQTFALGSPENSADGRVSFTHVEPLRAPRSGEFTSTIQGSFDEEGVFRGSLRATAEYTDPRHRGGVVTCRMPKERSARLVLRRR